MDGLRRFVKTAGEAAKAAGGLLGEAAEKLFGVGDHGEEIFKKPGKTGGEKWDKADDVTPPKEQYEKAKEEFAKKSFTDVYESIYRVSRGLSVMSNDVLEDLDSRIHYSTGCPNIQAFWLSLFANYENFTPEELKENTSKFLVFVFETGIKRDDSEEVTVDETTHRRYYNSGDGNFVKGEKMKVECACWSLGDKILEKGVLTSL